jgi:class 3 adenylate cyclase
MKKLQAARDKGGMVGERRVVTMLFCDLKGSTAAAEGLDPEDWTEIMNGAFAQMIKPVYQYEGTIARLMGDALLAFFGAPIAHEDDPRRAILAGLDIVEAIKPYREQIREKYGVDFDIRVGINTGLVVVGAVGSDLRRNIQRWEMQLIWQRGWNRQRSRAPCVLHTILINWSKTFSNLDPWAALQSKGRVSLSWLIKL